MVFSSLSIHLARAHARANRYDPLRRTWPAYAGSLASAESHAVPAYRDFSQERTPREATWVCTGGASEGSYASNEVRAVQTLAQGRQGVARKEKGLDCTHRGGPRESREGMRTRGARGECQCSKPHRVSALALAQDTSTRLHQDSRTGCMGARVIFCPIITSLRIEHGHLLCMFSTRLHPDSRTNGRSVCVSTLTRKRTFGLRLYPDSQTDDQMLENQSDLLARHQASIIRAQSPDHTNRHPHLRI